MVQIEAWDIGVLASGFGQLRDTVNHLFSPCCFPHLWNGDTTTLLTRMVEKLNVLKHFELFNLKVKIFLLIIAG